MSQSITPRQRALFVVFLLALFPASNALQPRMDEDTWWHLAVGKYVVEHRDVPREDPFSRIGQDEHLPWVAYSWLHEIALYGSYQLAGLPGVIAFRHLLDSLTFLTVAWFVLRRSGGSPLSLAVLALVTLTLVPMMLERPWHYTIVLTTLTIHATLEWRSGTPAWKFWWLVPAYALWANVHIQFVLGFGVMGLGLCVTVVERIRGYVGWVESSEPTKSRWRVPKSRWWVPKTSPTLQKGQKPLPWLALLAACFLATLFNPYHVRLYVVVWEYATQTGALRVVSELAPPDFHFRNWWNWALLALLLWAVYESLQSPVRLFETALLVVAAVLSLRMQRDIWFGAIVAAAVIMRCRRVGDSQSLPFRGLAAAVLAAILLTRIVWHLGPGADRGADRVNREQYPAGAVSYLREHRPPGPLFNHFNWGGYLIWSLPEYPVGMDGRTNLYGEERLQRAFDTWKALGWETDPDLLAAGVLLVPKKLLPKIEGEKTILELLTEATDRWRVVYEDKVAVVFVPIR